MTRVMISEPRYLPDMAYLSRAKAADVLLLQDYVELNTKSKQHKNKMLDDRGKPQWLKMPVKRKKNLTIDNAQLAIPSPSDARWWDDQIGRVLHDYRAQPYFDLGSSAMVEYFTIINDFCTQSDNYRMLVNELTKISLKLLNIDTKVVSLVDELSTDELGHLKSYEPDEQKAMLASEYGTCYLVDPTNEADTHRHTFVSTNFLDVQKHYNLPEGVDHPTLPFFHFLFKFGLAGTNKLL